jgi:hypothetical protein
MQRTSGGRDDPGADRDDPHRSADTNIRTLDLLSPNHADAHHGLVTTRHDPVPDRRRRAIGCLTPLRARQALHDWTGGVTPGCERVTTRQRSVRLA